MILIDTGPLVAILDSHDELHQLARRDLRQLAGQDLLVCSAVLSEACFFLTRVHQRRRLTAFLDELHVRPPAADADPVFRAEVFRWLEQYQEHEPDFADGCLSVLCGREKRSRVWTYDRKFATTWRRPDGSHIPLATKSP